MGHASEARNGLTARGAGNGGAGRSPGDVSVADYASSWLRAVMPGLRPSTQAIYTRAVHQVLVPALGARPLTGVRRADLLTMLERYQAAGASADVVAGDARRRARALVRDCQGRRRLRLRRGDPLPLRGYAPSTVRLMLGVVRVCLQAAVEQELLPANPAARLARHFRSPRRPAPSVTRAESEQILATIGATRPALYPIVLVMARTGCRVGEALGLRWEDIDWEARALHVARAWAERSRGASAPKSGRHRTVDMSAQLTATLRGIAATATSPWCFANPKTGRPFGRRWVQEAVLVARWDLGLTERISTKSFRHGFASTLVARGEPIAYVQRQLGHASITLTVDLYGSHQPMRRLAALDALDAVCAPAPAAAGPGTAGGDPWVG